MQELTYFSIKTLNLDLLNRFFYKNKKSVPKLEKIVLNFHCKSSNMRKLASSLLSLKLITNSNGKLTNATKSNLTLQIRKGSPCGCKITLRKKELYVFLSKIAILYSNENLKLNKRSNEMKNIQFYNVNNLTIFPNLKELYFITSTIPRLNIALKVFSTTQAELKFILNSINCLKKQI